MVARYALCALIVASLPSCAYRPEEVADPNAISLRQAVFDVADTLAATKQRTRYRDNVGLYVDEAVVTFNVAAKSTETTGLKLGASAPSGFIPITASADYALAAEGSRGNTVTITFKNVANLKGASPPKVMMKPARVGAAPVPASPTTPVAIQPSSGVPPIIIMGAPIRDPVLKRQLEDALENPKPQGR